VFKPSSPNATPIGSGTLPQNTSTTTIDLTLPETGSYSLLIAPVGLDVGSVNAQVRSYVTGTLAVDGSTPVSLSAGQNARFTFTAQASTGYGLAITGLSFTPTTGGSLQAVVRKTDGTFIANCPFNASGSCDLPPSLFPATGTYLMDFDPAGLNTASFTAVLSTDAAGTLPLDSAPTAVTTVRPGQNARYSFAGTAGQLVSVVLTGSTLDDGNPATNNTTGISVFKPSSSNATPIGSGTLPQNTSATTIDLTLPETGSYSLLIAPVGLDVGNVNAQVKSYVTGALTVDGSTPVSLSAGQNARFTFTAQASTGYGLAITGLSFSPSGGSMQAFLRKADGTLVTNCPFNASGSCDLPPSLFTTTGTYVMDFDPAGVNAASFTAVLSTDGSGTIPLDSAPTAVPIARAGQNARYQFTGTAGRLVSVVLTGNTLDDGNASTNNSTLISVFKPTSPNGSPIFSGAISTVTPGTAIDLTLPETGSYTVVIAPVGLDSGSINAQVKSYLTGTLAVDGSTPVSLSVGQNARFTFTAQAGTGYGMAVTGLAFSPSSTMLQAVVKKLDGTFLTNCPFTSSGSCDLPPSVFATTGTYLMDFDPQGMSSASFTAVMSTDASGTLALGGAAAGVAIARVGQNASYSFAGTAGQGVSVVVSASNLDDGVPGNNTTSVFVFKPSSPSVSPIGSGSFNTTATGVTFSVALPETGNYRILVSPAGLDTGSFNLRVQ
jgi:hypothetical protein